LIRGNRPALVRVKKMDRVEQMIAAGQFQEAEKVIRDSAGDPRAQYFAGLLAERQGETEKAIEAYEKVLETDPDSNAAMFRLAYVLDLHGDDDRAIEMYEACTVRPPVNVNALINLAILYEDHGEYESAAQCLRAILGNHPNHPRARLFLKDIDSAMNMFYDEDQERTKEHHSAILETAVADFELSVRSRNCLKKMNINKLGDLLRVTETELLAYKNFGETSLNEIKAMLSQKGLHLGQALEEGQPNNNAAPPVRREVALGAPPEILNKSVSEMELSVRSRKCLQRLNIATLGDLAIRTEAELLGTKNFGQTSLNEIKQRLKDNGLSLRRLNE